MKEILIQQIHAGFLKTGDKKDIGRFKVAECMPGQKVVKGTRATFFDRKGAKVKGIISDVSNANVLTIDTFV